MGLGFEIGGAWAGDRGLGMVMRVLGLMIGGWRLYVVRLEGVGAGFEGIGA